MIHPCNNETIKKALNIIDNGGIIIYPTDTLYGFGVDATNSNAIEKLNNLKNRKDPLSIIVSSKDEIEQYGEIKKDSKKIINKIFPGPFTILIDSLTSDLSPLVTPGSNYIGLRIPDHWFPIKVVEKLGKPIITTSVNRKNEPSLTDVYEMQKKFPDINIFQDDINIDSKGSTIINLSENPHLIIRQGDGTL